MLAVVSQPAAPQGLSEGAHIIHNSGLAPAPLSVLFLCLPGTQIPPAFHAKGCSQEKQPHHVCHLPCPWPAHLSMHFYHTGIINSSWKLIISLEAVQCNVEVQIDDQH